MSTPLKPSGVASHPMVFIADVHGNLPALEAVLGELERHDAREVLVAGDLLLGGAQPLEVWHRLQGLKARCVRGLSDAALANIDPNKLTPIDEQERKKAERFADTRRRLGDLVVERLKRLPDRLRIPMIDGREIVMVHGCPSDPTQELTHDLSDDEMLSLVGDDPADIVVCGGSHVPFMRQLDELLVVNVGSVGEAPEGRIAHYTVVRPRMEGAEVGQYWVEY